MFVLQYLVEYILPVWYKGRRVPYVIINTDKKKKKIVDKIILSMRACRW